MRILIAVMLICTMVWVESCTVTVKREGSLPPEWDGTLNGHAFAPDLPWNGSQSLNLEIYPEDHPPPKAIEMIQPRTSQWI